MKMTTSPSPLSKFIVDAFTKHPRTFWSVVAVTALGGTAVAYLVRNTIRRNSGFQPISSGSRPSSGKNCSEREVTFNDLPIETRHKIWKFLPYKDLLTLRLVSPVTKDDVETGIGVKVVISQKHGIDHFQFSQRVGLQSCALTNLPLDPSTATALGSDYLLNPGLLLVFRLIEKSPIPLETVRNILSPCTNIRKLELRFLHCLNTNEISDLVLHILPNLPYLTELHVFRMAMYPPRLKTFQDHSHPPGRSRISSFPVSEIMKKIEVELPDVEDSHLPLWKCVFEQQTQLKTFAINLGVVHWHLVRPTIMRNPKLEKISLDGMCNLDPATERQEREAFDWSIFQNCHNLTIFEIGCPPLLNGVDIEPMDSIHFVRFPKTNIEEFYIYKVILTRDDVRRVYTEMQGLRSGSLNNIGDQGIVAAAELFWLQNHNGGNWPGQREEGGQFDRLLDIVSTALIGLATILMVIGAARLQPPLEDQKEASSEEEILKSK